MTVFVPHYAMSGGTLIALAADEIVMAENAVLGPVDPQLGQSPAASILKVMERKPIARIDDSTIIQADMAEKALRQVEEVGARPPRRADARASSAATARRDLQLWDVDPRLPDHRSPRRATWACRSAPTCRPWSTS